MLLASSIRGHEAAGALLKGVVRLTYTSVIRPNLAVDSNTVKNSQTTATPHTSGSKGHDMARDKPCPSRTLPDVPARQDELGPHRDIARAVASLIEDESGGKAVALIGSWGSGKSTVVNLLEDELEQSDSVEVLTFVFDAWVHEGDPLRLAFLRTFATHLQHGWGGPDWSDRLDRLEKKTEETISEAATEIDRLSAVVLLALSILPLGYLIVANGLDRTSPLRWWGTWLGVALVAPFVAILVRALWRVLRGQSTHVPALLARQLPETLTVSTVRTPDPTSLEFQDVFSEMVREALEKHPAKRRLVIVADNLDRVDRETALRAWGTMRSFFDMTSRSDDEVTRWREQLWLVVPFDPGGVSRLWAEHEEDESPARHGGLETSPAAEHGSLVDAFLDKTFQVSFHVPPPVLSDWRGFLVSCLEEALPRHAPNDEFHEIYRIVHRHVAVSGWLPTPRNLKKFVNRLSAIHRQWCKAGVSLEVQARYALHGDRVEITSQGVLEVAGEEVRDVDVARQIAAIHFNVDPEKAFQVILSPRVERALTEGDDDAIEGMAETPGFFEVCEHLLDGTERRGVVDVGNAARAISRLSSDQTPYVRRIWHRLEQLATSLSSLEGLNGQVAEGLVRIVEEVPDRERASSLGEFLLNRSTSTTSGFSVGEDGTNPDELSAFASGIARLVHRLRESLGEDEVPQSLELGGDEAVLIELLAGVASVDHGAQVFGSFVPSDGRDITGFAASVREGEFSARYSAAFVLGLQSAPDRQYGPFVDAAEEFLKQPSVGWDSGLPLIGALTGLWRYDSGDDGIARPAMRGALLHHFQEAVGRSDWPVAATCAIPVLLTDPKVQTFEPIMGHSNNGAILLRQIMENPAQHGELSNELARTIPTLRILSQWFAATLESTSATHLGVAVLASTIEEQGTQHGVPPEILFEHFAPISAQLTQAQMEALIDGMQQSSQIEERLRKAGFRVGDATAYSRVVGAEGWDGLCPLLREALRNVPEAHWVKDLEANRELLDLARVLAAAGCDVNLVAPFRAAVLGLIQESLNGSAIAIPSLSELSSVMAAQSLRALLRSAADLLGRTEVGDASALLDVLGDELVHSGVIDEDRISPLIANYGPAAIGRSNSTELGWLRELLSTYGAKNIAPEAAGALRGSVHSKFNDTSLTDEAREELQEILRQLGRRGQSADG